MHNHYENTLWQNYLLEARTDSAYLAAPSPHSPGMDIFTVLNHVNLLVKDFYKKLFKQEPFSAETKVLFRSTDQLNELYLKEKQNIELLGVQTLGLGFPLFIAKEGDKQLIAPLFIWPLKLKPKAKQKDRWTISYDPLHPPKINNYLLDYLYQKRKLDLKAIFSDFLQDGQLNPARLEQYAVQFCEQLALQSTEGIANLRSLPTQRQLANSAPPGMFIWSGILRNFLPQLNRIIERLRPIPSSKGKEAAIALRKNFNQHNFARLPFDPAQSKVLKQYQQYQTCLIQGPAGTGKSYTLTNIISNALSNGQKCLVVAPYLPTLQNIRKELRKIALDPFTLLLTDPENDREQLLVAIKEHLKKRRRPAGYDVEHYKRILSTNRNSEKQLSTAMDALSTAFFGPFQWAELVGFFLKNNAIEQRALMEDLLEENSFKFNYHEYEILRKDIEVCATLFRKLQTLKHPLLRLHDNNFQQGHLVESKNGVENKIEYFAKKLTQLKYRYILKLNDYKAKLEKYYSSQGQELLENIERLRINIDNFSARYGSSIDQPNGRLRIFSVFSPKYKSILEAKAKLKQEYHQLRKDFQDTRIVSHHFLGGEAIKKPQLIKKNIALLRQNLQTSKANLPAFIEEKTNNLTKDSVLAQLDFSEQLEELTYAQQMLVEELNNAELLQKTIENDVGNLPSRQLLLEETIADLDDLRLNMRDFNDFYNWQSYWLRLPDLSRMLIEALAKRKPNNWLAAFSSWYLHRVLKKHQPEDQAKQKNLKKSFIKNQQLLRQTLEAQTSYYWSGKHNKSALKQVLRQNQIDLQSLMAAHFSTISNTFPVVLCTATFAAEILPEQQRLFDLILIDDAQQIPMEYAIPAIQLGEQLIIAGSCHHSTLPRQNDLFSTLLNREDTTSFPLNIIHLDRPKELLNFQHAAFHPKLEIFSKRNSEYSSIAEVFSTKGIFNPEDGINQAESIKVIELVLQTEKTADHLYPKLSVICFTRAQQQLIADRLLRISQGTDLESEKTRALFSAGLGVYHIEALQAIKPDAVIVSLTYGITETTAQICAEIHALNEPTGLAFLRLISSGNYEKIQFCHSIPEENLRSWTKQYTAFGQYTVAQFIHYLSAIQVKNKSKQKQVLQELQKTAPSNETTAKKNLFPTEVAKALYPFFGVERIKINPIIAKVSVPLAIKPLHPGQAPIAIKIDDSFQSLTMAVEWEQQKDEIFKYLGLDQLNTWSIDWWKDPELAARKLASQIIKLDEAYEQR